MLSSRSSSKGRNTTSRTNPPSRRTGGRTISGKGRKHRKSAPGKKGLRIDWWVPALATTIVLVAVLFPLLRKISPGEGPTIPKGDYEFGIDLSHHNASPIVWDSLMVMTGRDARMVSSKHSASDFHRVDFVFLKATEGASMKDKDFQKRWLDAGMADIARGAYHFYRTSKDPIQQAKNFCSTVGPLRYRDLPPVLDIETSHKGYSRKNLNQDLKVWLEFVENHYGRKPIIYTYESFARTHLSKDILSNYPLWMAHYGVPAPDRTDWAYWQFTDKGLVYGIPGHVDVSVRKRN